MPDAVAFPAMTFGASRQVLAQLLARLAYGLFYLGVTALMLGVPVGLGYLLWRWLAG